MKGLTVVFRGLEHTVDVDVGRTTCNEFLQLLVAALHEADLLLAVHTLKLLVPKKKILQLDKQPQMTLSDAGRVVQVAVLTSVVLGLPGGWRLLSISCMKHSLQSCMAAHVFASYGVSCCTQVRELKPLLLPHHPLPARRCLRHAPAVGWELNM